MARKRSGNGKGGVSSGGKASAAPGAKINKMNSYEDTLEPGSVEDFMFKRDQISFNPQDDSDDDVNGDEGEEVLSLKMPKKSSKSQQDGEEDYDEEEEEDLPKRKERKAKMKADVSGKGRFGKPIVSSDEDEDDEDASSSGSGSDSDDENWGRQYYSRPSNRREKEEGKVDDEKREEEREMEEREVRRLQRKAREVLQGEDFGFIDDADDEVVAPLPKAGEEQVAPRVVPAAPTSAEPETLLRHLQAYEPVKLALVQDFPLVVKKLEKTAKGIKKMEEQDGEGELHKGLGWLHYQTLLTYATTLAFYIHISSLPPSSPSESEIDIIPRLLLLKEGLSMLEDLDFAAGSVSDGAFVLNQGGMFGENEDDEELKEGKMELLNRMREVNGEDGDEDDEGDWQDDDGDDLWGKEGLEEGELEALLRDAEDDEEAEELRAMLTQSQKANKKGKKAVFEDEMDIDLEEDAIMPKKSKKDKKDKKDKTKKSKKASAPEQETSAGASSTPAFAPLAEPEFFTSSKSSKSSAAYDDADVLGDPTALGNADFADKQSRKRSLAFHTSKINQTLARRAEGRANRMGGDEDLPYRDRRKARDDALKRNGPKAEGEDLEELPANRPEKRLRDDDDLDGEGEGSGAGAGDDDDAEGYYDLVKRRRKEEKDAKEAEHEAYEAEKLAAIAALDDEDHEGGPRALTRAIEKNRGLTPRRSESGRNPRVKKRQAYEKAKKKVASQRSVYKGGQSAYGSDYKGEKTGITKVVKSRKF
ncbi:hypothetical protein IAT40_003557 [Kwoniella sp. CBS 6097]